MFEGSAKSYEVTQRKKTIWQHTHTHTYSLFIALVMVTEALCLFYCNVIILKAENMILWHSTGIALLAIWQTSSVTNSTKGLKKHHFPTNLKHIFYLAVISCEQYLFLFATLTAHICPKPYMSDMEYDG